jgi:hypothetical protein
MPGSIAEKDWRIFRDLHPIWLDRFCESVNHELVAMLSDKNQSPHDRYIAVYKLIHKRDKELGTAFDDFRRSTALFQIAIIRKLGVITDEELGRFSAEVQSSLAYFRGEDRESTAPK